MTKGLNFVVSIIHEELETLRKIKKELLKSEIIPKARILESSKRRRDWRGRDGLSYNLR
jgi:hypothetical protein